MSDSWYLDGFPLLAFAIIRGRRANLDTSGLVKHLLANRVNPLSIPGDMWIEYWKTPDAKTFKGRTDLPQWCNDQARTVLMSALHFTHRYSLHRAMKLRKRMRRDSQIAKRTRTAGLSNIPCFLVGHLQRTSLWSAFTVTLSMGRTSR
jgi:hypothetical protein